MYDAVGGWPVIEKLVEDFYRIMATDPVARDCFNTHSGKDLTQSAEKLKMFLSGWLGGPKLYLEKHGHPRLRMRHGSFSIGARESEQWLYCMKKAFELSTVPVDIQLRILKAFADVAGVIRNRAD